MLREEIYTEAINRIQARRTQAQMTQAQRTDAVRHDIPETAELDNRLRTACLSILQATRTADPDLRTKRMAEISAYSMEADKMLRQILSQNGLPEDYLDTPYTCRLCSDTGFVEGRPCECLKREIGVVGAERLNAQSQLSLCSFDTFSLDYYKMLPPEQFQVMQHIYEGCREYADHFSPKTSGNILMIGDTGLGKTHLSLSIAAVLLEQGYSVVYDSAGNLLHTLEREQFSRERSDDTLSLLLECDLLILDDFGTEFSTSFTQSMIYTIFNSRLGANRPMIINTNLSKHSLQEQYGSRILSRLFTSRILQFYGKDIRLQKSMQQTRG